MINKASIKKINLIVTLIFIISMSLFTPLSLSNETSHEDIGGKISVEHSDEKHEETSHKHENHSTGIHSHESNKLKDMITSENLSFGFILLSLFIAMFLGAAHTLEPGHGKTLFAAYLVGTKGTVKNAVQLGIIATLTHTFTVIIMGILLLIASKYIQMHQIFPFLGIVSGLCVISVGLWLFVHTLKSLHKKSDSLKNHEHKHLHATDIMEEGLSFKSLVTLGISGGLVPCPAALVILLIAVSMDKIVFGLLIILFFSLGIAIILISVGILVVKTRTFINKFSETQPIIQKLPLISSILITIMGFLIILKTLVMTGIISIKI